MTTSPPVPGSDDTPHQEAQEQAVGVEPRRLTEASAKALRPLIASWQRRLQRLDAITAALSGEGSIADGVLAIEAEAKEIGVFQAWLADVLGSLCRGETKVESTKLKEANHASKSD